MGLGVLWNMKFHPFFRDWCCISYSAVALIMTICQAKYDFSMLSLLPEVLGCSTALPDSVLTTSVKIFDSRNEKAPVLYADSVVLRSDGIVLHCPIALLWGWKTTQQIPVSIIPLKLPPWSPLITIAIAHYGLQLFWEERVWDFQLSFCNGWLFIK